MRNILFVFLLIIFFCSQIYCVCDWIIIVVSYLIIVDFIGCIALHCVKAFVGDIRKVVCLESTIGGCENVCGLTSYNCLCRFICF